MKADMKELRRRNKVQAYTIGQLLEQKQRLHGFGKEQARRDSWNLWRRLRWAITQR